MVQIYRSSIDESIQEFVQKKLQDHFTLLAKSLLECQKARKIIDVPIPLLLTQVIGSIGLSNLVPEMISCLGIPDSINLKSKQRSMSNEEEIIKQRVAIVLRGITR